MKKIILFVSIFLLIGGICIAQSSNPEDYAAEDMYVFCGNIDSIGQKDYKTRIYSFIDKPNFADESDNFFIALSEGKILPLSRCQESISFPITMSFEKEKGFFCDGYFCKSYSISDDYKIYEEAVKRISENREVSSNMLKVPFFLENYKNDVNPIGTKFSCETSVFFNGRDIQVKESFPFSFVDTITDSKGKKKKKNRSILILTVYNPQFNISDEGSVIDVILPEKEKFETPFGEMELFRTEINLKTKIPSEIKIGKTTSIFDPKDYEEKALIFIKDETELKAIYQTRKGYELKNDVCAKTVGAYLTEKDGEFYIGSIHLICNDDAYSIIHTSVIKKDYLTNLLIDLRFVDDKIIFVIAPKVY